MTTYSSSDLSAVLLRYSNSSWTQSARIYSTVWFMIQLLHATCKDTDRTR